MRKISYLAIAGGLAALAPAHVSAQLVGSSSQATQRDCSSVTATEVCDGTGPGQTVVTRSFGGGVGVVGSNILDIGGGNVAYSNTSFGALGMPVIRAYTAAPGDVRMNINVFAYQSFVYSGPAASPFGIAGSLHIVDSSGAPLGGALPGGSIYSQYVGIWSPSILAGISSARDLFSALFFADCGTPGVLARGFSTGDLAGGEQSLGISSTSCSGSPIILSPGDEVLVVAGLQLPVNRGGFADSTATFRTSLDTSSLSQAQVTNLETNLVSAVARGASVTSVPEPTTWAMMIAGFGWIGAAIRRRRNKGAPAAA